MDQTIQLIQPQLIKVEEYINKEQNVRYGEAVK